MHSNRTRRFWASFLAIICLTFTTFGCGGGGGGGNQPSSTKTQENHASNPPLVGSPEPPAVPPTETPVLITLAETNRAAVEGREVLVIDLGVSSGRKALTLPKRVAATDGEFCFFDYGTDDGALRVYKCETAAGQGDISQLQVALGAEVHVMANKVVKVITETATDRKASGLQVSPAAANAIQGLKNGYQKLGKISPNGEAPVLADTAGSVCKLLSLTEVGEMDYSAFPPSIRESLKGVRDPFTHGSDVCRVMAQTAGGATLGVKRVAAMDGRGYGTPYLVLAGTAKACEMAEGKGVINASYALEFAAENFSAAKAYLDRKCGNADTLLAVASGNSAEDLTARLMLPTLIEDAFRVGMLEKTLLKWKVDPNSGRPAWLALPGNNLQIEGRSLSGTSFAAPSATVHLQVAFSRGVSKAAIKDALLSSKLGKKVKWAGGYSWIYNGKKAYDYFKSRHAGLSEGWSEWEEDLVDDSEIEGEEDEVTPPVTQPPPDITPPTPPVTPPVVEPPPPAVVGERILLRRDAEGKPIGPLDGHTFGPEASNPWLRNTNNGSQFAVPLQNAFLMIKESLRVKKGILELEQLSGDQSTLLSRQQLSFASTQAHDLYTAWTSFHSEDFPQERIDATRQLNPGEYKLTLKNTLGGIEEVATFKIGGTKAQCSITIRKGVWSFGDDGTGLPHNREATLGFARFKLLVPWVLPNPDYATLPDSHLEAIGGIRLSDGRYIPPVQGIRTSRIYSTADLLTGVEIGLGPLKDVDPDKVNIVTGDLSVRGVSYHARNDAIGICD